MTIASIIWLSNQLICIIFQTYYEYKTHFLLLLFVIKTSNWLVSHRDDEDIFFLLHIDLLFWLICSVWWTNMWKIVTFGRATYFEKIGLWKSNWNKSMQINYIIEYAWPLSPPSTIYEQVKSVNERGRDVVICYRTAIKYHILSIHCIRGYYSRFNLNLIV